MDRPTTTPEVADEISESQSEESETESTSGGAEDNRGGRRDDDVLDGENQVVPWSSTTPPPAASMTSSSSTDASDPRGRESIDSVDVLPLKRYRHGSVTVSSFQSGTDRPDSPAGGDDDDGGEERSKVDNCWSWRSKRRRTRSDRAL